MAALAGLAKTTYPQFIHTEEILFGCKILFDQRNLALPHFIHGRFRHVDHGLIAIDRCAVVIVNP
jgi:hypothetical protein